MSATPAAAGRRLCRAERDGAAVRIRMEWPERRNALSLAMMDQLRDAVRRAAAGSETRAIVLAGSGPALQRRTRPRGDRRRRPRLAAADLRRVRPADGDAARGPPAGHRRSARHRHRRRVPARGRVRPRGGQRDLPVRHPRAFGSGCSAPPRWCRCPAQSGESGAMEMLLTGEPVDAATALEWGLVNRVVPEADLEATTRVFVERIASASPFVMALGKRAFYRQADLPARRRRGRDERGHGRERGRTRRPRGGHRVSPEAPARLARRVGPPQRRLAGLSRYANRPRSRWNPRTS